MIQNEATVDNSAESQMELSDEMAASSGVTMVRVTAVDVTVVKVTLTRSARTAEARWVPVRPTCQELTAMLGRCYVVGAFCVSVRCLGTTSVPFHDPLRHLFLLHKSRAQSDAVGTINVSTSRRRCFLSSLPLVPA